MSNDPFDDQRTIDRLRQLREQREQRDDDPALSAKDSGDEALDYLTLRANRSDTGAPTGTADDAAVDVAPDDDPDIQAASWKLEDVQISSYGVVGDDRSEPDSAVPEVDEIVELVPHTITYTDVANVNGPSDEATVDAMAAKSGTDVAMEDLSLSAHDIDVPVAEHLGDGASGEDAPTTQATVDAADFMQWQRSITETSVDGTDAPLASKEYTDEWSTAVLTGEDEPADLLHDDITKTEPSAGSTEPAPSTQSTEADASEYVFRPEVDDEVIVGVRGDHEVEIDLSTLAQSEEDPVAQAFVEEPVADVAPPLVSEIEIDHVGDDQLGDA